MAAALPRSADLPAAGRDRAEGETLWSIQYLRGLAALSVTLYHALQWENGGFDVGRAGVDVFFVISGVIMWRVTAGRAVGAGRFLRLRATRVAPLYWLMTLAVAATAVAWPGFLPEVHPAWDHLALSLAFIPHLDPRGLPFPLLPPGWTLSYEAGFYLLFAASLLLPARWRAAAVTAGLAAVVAAGFTLSDPAYILGANPMLLQFAAGVWLGVALKADRLPGRAWGCGLLVLGLASFLLLLLTGFTDELWRPLIWGLPASLLVAGALSIEAHGGAGRWRAPRELGDASYALYLVHLPATALVAHTLGAGRPWLFLPAAVTASIAAALATHAWIEKPLVRLARKFALLTGSIGNM